MLDAKLIKKLFKALDVELRAKKVTGEIGLCGGAVMCLVFQTREATKDVDAVFEPTREIREAARAVAAKFDIPEDWLNDAAKGYFYADPPRENILDLPNLRVWAPSADYLLAMKSISARYDTQDKDDVIFLVNHLSLSTPEAVFAIIRRYYPDKKIPAKTKFFIEELLTG